MPKIFEANGFVIYIYPLEATERHHALHIHIYRGSHTGPAMVVQIPDFQVLVNTMNASDTKKVKRLLLENMNVILEKVRENQ